MIVIKYSVKSNELISPSVALLTLEPSTRHLIHFEAGQYAAISFKKSNRPSHVRCFSIVSSPTQNNILQFAMRIKGDFTQSAAQLVPGDSVYVQGPFGDFVIDADFDRNVVLMAGGIGITPYMSMIRYAADVKFSLPITLLYSCSNTSDVPFFDELVELQKRNPKFHVIFLVNGANILTARGATALEGRITDERLSRLTNGRWNTFTFFVCGPAEYMKNVQEILRVHGTEEDRIVSEEFKQNKQTLSLESNPKKLVYSFSSLLLIMSVVGVMGVDLVRAVPKIAAKQNAAANSSLTQSSTSSIVQQGLNTNPSNSTNSGSANSNTSTTSMPVSTTYYQQPITSVS